MLPVGGIKEKVLAAHRAGIKRVIVPERNRADLFEEVPKEVVDELQFVSRMEQVLEAALESMPQPTPEGTEEARDGEKKDAEKQPAASSD